MIPKALTTTSTMMQHTASATSPHHPPPHPSIITASANACCLTPIRQLSPAQTASIFLHTPGSPHPHRHILGGDHDEDHFMEEDDVRDLHSCFSFDSQDSLFLPSFESRNEASVSCRIPNHIHPNRNILNRQSPTGLMQHPSSSSAPVLHLKPRAAAASSHMMKHSPRDAKRHDPAVASLHMEHLFLH